MFPKIFREIDFGRPERCRDARRDAARRAVVCAL